MSELYQLICDELNVKEFHQTFSTEKGYGKVVYYTTTWPDSERAGECWLFFGDLEKKLL